MAPLPRRIFFPVSWTDLAQSDPFVALADGQAIARIEDLLRLAGLVKDLRLDAVKENRPNL